MSKKPPSEVIFKYEDGTPVALLDEVRCLDAEQTLKDQGKGEVALPYTVMDITRTHITCRLKGGSAASNINSMHYGISDIKLIIKIRGASDAA